MEKDNLAPRRQESLFDDAPPAGGDPQRQLRRRRLWKRLRWLFLVPPLAFLGYLVVQLFIIMAPQMRYETALQGTMTDAITVQGQAVMEAVQVTGGGVPLYYTVEPGQRVAAGAQVAQAFATEQAAAAMVQLDALRQEQAYLQEALDSHTEAGDLDPLLAQMQSGLYSLLEEIESGRYGALAEPEAEFSLAANKLQLATGQAAGFDARMAALAGQIEALQQQAAATGSVTAPQNGYFIPTTNQDELMPDPEAISAMTPAQLQQALAQPARYYGGEVAGHIVTDYRWHFHAVVTARQAEKFTEGDRSLTLEFPDAGNVSVPVIVEEVRVDEAEGLATIVLYCEYTSADTLRLRTEQARIVFDVKKGLLIDKNALRLVDETDAEGNAVTHKGVYVKFGNMVYFRKIKILVEDDFYMLVPMETEDGVNEVELYDEIVVDAGGVELYDRKILSNA